MQSQGNEFDMNDLFNNTIIEYESQKLLICIQALQKTIEESFSLDRENLTNGLINMYKAFLAFRCQSDTDLKKLLMSDTFAPRNMNQIMLLITTTFLSLHKIRFSFIEGQKRITCYRFMLFGRLPIGTNHLAHDKGFLFSECSDQNQKQLETALMNSTVRLGFKFFYHQNYKNGMSTEAAACYKDMSSLSAFDKELSEKLSWDNLYSTLLTKHTREMVNFLESPDQDYSRDSICRKISNKVKDGNMYFELHVPFCHAKLFLPV